MAAESILPRKVVALYQSSVYDDIAYTKMHQLAESPLNFLGLILEYHDIDHGLPDLEGRDDVLGVLTWFPKYTELPDSFTYLKWSLNAMELGKRFVMLGAPGFYAEKSKVPPGLIEEFWGSLGLIETGPRILDTYLTKLVYRDREMIGFERGYQDVLPDYPKLVPIPNKIEPYLLALQKGDRLCLVGIGERGAYAAEGYAVYEISEEGEFFRKWYINPFSFFQRAFALDHSPVPDPTTLVGRRLFFSQIDGDGWNSITELNRYRYRNVCCAEVIHQHVLSLYLDIPVTVGAVGAELDQKWVGTAAGRKAAEKIYKLPNVQAGSHTFTHPFDWGFFKNYDPSVEETCLALYPHGGWKGWRITGAVKKFLGLVNCREVLEEEEDPEGFKDYAAEELQLWKSDYDIPRAYALKPFDLDLEVEGSIQVVEAFLPEGNRCRLYQWSGNCLPFLEAMERVKQAGVRNLNGGDTRFDREYLSYGWVGPVGRQVGTFHQIYASNSNENVYTNNWRDRFYGFSHLPETFANTETPIRIKPIDLYYHMYSGEKLPALEALLKNIHYIQSEHPIAMTAWEYSGIGEGFYSAEIAKLQDGVWKVRKRGDLNTMRFDRSAAKGVDFTRSKGVLGQRHFQGALYVALDPREDEPLIALKPLERIDREPVEERPCLIESSWNVRNFQVGAKGFSFECKGWGPLEMTWTVPQDGDYTVKINGGESSRVKAADGLLALRSDSRSFRYPAKIAVEYAGE